MNHPSSQSRNDESLLEAKTLAVRARLPKYMRDTDSAVEALARLIEEARKPSDYPLSETKDREWIAFADRLPDEIEHEYVLATCGDDRPEIYLTDLAIEYSESDPKLTHWMPLPEAPK